MSQSTPSGKAPAGKPPPGKPDGPRNRKSQRKNGRTVIVRYGLMRHVGEFRHNLDSVPRPGTKVVVRSERGVDLGEVVAAVSDWECAGAITPRQLGEFLEGSGPEYPFRRGGKVLRLANAQDTIDHRHLNNSAREEAAYCREQIRQLELNMKLVTAEHLLGGERIIFYFTAEARVDFRGLVRHLAGQYRTRIEMRQIGARDEARLVADYERCGQPCCCRKFLKYLKPISMRMAKIQKATLDPSKISGRCGRLMCCLQYEDACYEELRGKLPRKNTWVRTAEHVGRVVDTQILTQLVRISLRDATTVVVANEEIIERDVEPPLQQTVPQAERSGPAGVGPGEPRAVAQRPPASYGKRRRRNSRSAGRPNLSQQQSHSDKPTKKKRKRRKEKPK